MPKTGETIPDFELLNQDGKPTKVSDYRGRKDTAVALFMLWLIGEVMTSTRRRFEREGAG